MSHEEHSFVAVGIPIGPRSCVIEQVNKHRHVHLPAPVTAQPKFAVISHFIKHRWTHFPRVCIPEMRAVRAPADNSSGCPTQCHFWQIPADATIAMVVCLSICSISRVFLCAASFLAPSPTFIALGVVLYEVGTAGCSNQRNPNAIVCCRSGAHFQQHEQ